MIQRIDVENLGSFRSFRWDTVRDPGNNVVAFRRMNILYGRNYAGKTTLSRIVRSLETGELPPKYEDPKFRVVTTSGVVTQDALANTDLHVRVYNRDFVREHLSFLVDEEGEITSFAVVGQKNTDIERELGTLEVQLGSIDQQKGLRYELAQHQETLQSRRSALKKLQKDLEARLRNKATAKPQGIKHKPIFKDPNYNTPKIRADIDRVRREELTVLGEEEREVKKKLLQEVPLPNISQTLEFESSLEVIHETATRHLQRELAPTRPIQDLLDDRELQAWVREGIQYHRDVRTTCGFCRRELPPDFWELLDAHFNEESQDFEQTIDSELEGISKERDSVRDLLDIDPNRFYQTLRSAVKAALSDLGEEVEQYVATLDGLEEALNRRKSDLFTPVAIPPLELNPDTCLGAIQTVNALIERHNTRAASLSDEQRKARNRLRLDEVAQFMSDIDLAREEAKIEDAHASVNEATQRVEALRQQVAVLEERMDTLRSGLTDETEGARRVNQYLNHFFGHDALRLEAVEDADSATWKFQVLRGDGPAFNLSEGECSLIAFCYFIAKLEAADSADKKLVVFIDDPVSSLDANHIFFVYSLIESVLARPVLANGEVVRGEGGTPELPYHQLFISTHNLEFLKYVKRLRKPPGKGNHEQFLVASKEAGSVVEPMPKYLKEYVTEFNYLFAQIFKCRDPGNIAVEGHAFYSFGNNLRKFLEALLFFKYPFSSSASVDHKERIEEFFGSEPATAPLVQRLTNELSHLTERFDRSVQPLDHAEISKLADFVLRTMRKNDPGQFRYLLRSIEEMDPYEAEPAAPSGT